MALSLGASSGIGLASRDQRHIEHTVQELVSQRLHGLALDYEDLNDHDHLWLDPISRDES
jgi:uncharacterized ferritin-like protein (DUF455 family)